MLQELTEEKAEGQEKEAWNPVRGYENWYSVSSFGNVRREKTGPGARLGRILRPELSGAGNRKYYRVVLSKNSIKKHIFIHRLVYSSFIGPIPNQLQINHKDLDKLNNKIGNLECVTAKENQNHARLNREYNILKGEDVGNSKLTNEDVIYIRKIYKEGTMNQFQISKKFNISPSNISHIIRKKRWKHL